MWLSGEDRTSRAVATDASWAAAVAAANAGQMLVAAHIPELIKKNEGMAKKFRRAAETTSRTMNRHARGAIGLTAAYK